MSRKEIKAYTLTNARNFGSNYEIFAITSESGRRINGHYVSASAFGSHITEKRAFGRFGSEDKARGAIDSLKAVVAEHEPAIEIARHQLSVLESAKWRAIEARLAAIVRGE